MLYKRFEVEVEYAEAEKTCPNGICSIVKTAEVKPDVFNDVKLKKNHAYLYVIAMGAGEYYGPNKNGDFFREKDLIQYYPKFLNAGVFIQHDNKDPNKSIGKVLKAEYNKKMHRVELLLEIKKDLAPAIYNAIEQGQRIAVSMGVKVPEESCSICGKITKDSLANRCEHLKYHLKEILPDGRQVYAINHPPLNFFDISIVRVPADAQGYALFQKTASLNQSKHSIRGLGNKVGLQKLAELVKRIDAMEVYNPLTYPEIRELRATPRDILKAFLISNDIVLKPSEYIAIGNPMVGPSEYDFLTNCGIDTGEGFLKLIEAIQNTPSIIIERRIIKVAEFTPNTETLRKIKSRDELVKIAVKEDIFGHRDIISEPVETPKALHIYRRFFRNSRFAQIKFNFTNGDSITHAPDDIDLLLPFVEDSGVVESIYGIMPNGVEVVLTDKLLKKKKDK